MISEGESCTALCGTGISEERPFLVHWTSGADSWQCLSHLYPRAGGIGARILGENTGVGLTTGGTQSRFTRQDRTSSELLRLESQILSTLRLLTSFSFMG